MFKQISIIFSLLALLSVNVLGQAPGSNAQTVQLTAPTPPMITQSNAQVVGTNGSRLFFYWIVATYPIGKSIPFGPAQVNRVPDTLSVSNYVRLNWNPAPNATGYDILRTTTPYLPSGTGNILVTTIGSGSTATYNNQSETISSYSVVAASSAAESLTLDNLNYNLPVLRFSTFPIVPAFLGNGTPTQNCVPSQQFFQLDATAGNNIWLCTAVNTWTQLTGGGGGGGGIHVIPAVQGSGTFTYTVPASSTSVLFTATLTENVTLTTLNNPIEGMLITFSHTQDGTGGRTFTTPLNTSGMTLPNLMPGATTTQTGIVGSDLIWRPIAGAIITNLGGTAGFSTCIAGTPPTNPPTGSLYVYCDQSDLSMYSKTATGVTTRLGGPTVNCGVGTSVVDSATPTTLGTVTWAGGLAAGQMVRITAYWNHTGGTTLTPRVRLQFNGSGLDGGTGEMVGVNTDTSFTTNGTVQVVTTTSERTSIVYSRNATGVYYTGLTAEALAINVSGSTSLTFQGFFSASGNPGETITLSNYCVEKLPQ